MSTPWWLLLEPLETAKEKVSENLIACLYVSNTAPTVQTCLPSKCSIVKYYAISDLLLCYRK